MRTDNRYHSTKLMFCMALALALVPALLAQAQESAGQDIPDEIVKKVDPSVVAIRHERAVGSGFIVTKDGYIISNGHVVKGNEKEDPTEPAKSITVILNDERKFSARVLGFCMNPDVAVLKIDCEEDLVPAEFGDSRGARIGQKVFAVGTPHGLKRTFSSGILSNVDRTDLNTLTTVFQTDAAINPGNSGGPLFDRGGKALGINTYASRGANNLGFTIPIHVVEKLYRDIREHGRFIRADVPIFSCRELYEELRRALGVEQGILVDYVMEDTAAESAGLRQGDIIIEQNGQPVSARTQAELKTFEWSVITMQPGTPINWTVLRGNNKKRKRVKLKAILEESEPMPDTHRFPGELKTEKYDALGLSFQRIVLLHRVMLGLQDDPGILVVDAAKDSPAAKAGLRRNDIITEVGGKPVSNVASFCNALESRFAEGEKYVDILVRRQRHLHRTALAPYYDLADKRILVVVPPGKPRFLDLVLRELAAQGATLTLLSPGGNLGHDCPAVKRQAIPGSVDSKDVDILLLLDSDEADRYWQNKDILKLVRDLHAEEKLLAAAGGSTITLLAAAPVLLEKKTATSKTHSAEAIKRNAQYTGGDVERDAGILTTSGSDRQVMRDFLKQLGRAE